MTYHPINTPFYPKLSIKPYEEYIIFTDEPHIDNNLFIRKTGYQKHIILYTEHIENANPNADHRTHKLYHYTGNGNFARESEDTDPMIFRTIADAKTKIEKIRNKKVEPSSRVKSWMITIPASLSNTELVITDTKHLLNINTPEPRFVVIDNFYYDKYLRKPFDFTAPLLSTSLEWSAPKLTADGEIDTTAIAFKMFFTIQDTLDGIRFKYHITPEGKYRVRCPKCGAPLISETELGLKIFTNDLPLSDHIGYTTKSEYSIRCGNCDVILSKSLIETIFEQINE